MLTQQSCLFRGGERGQGASRGCCRGAAGVRGDISCDSRAIWMKPSSPGLLALPAVELAIETMWGHRVEGQSRQKQKQKQLWALPTPHPNPGHLPPFLGCWAPEAG